MAFISGKRGRFKSGSTAIPCKQFRINMRSQGVETTSGESGGFETYINGIAGCDITATVAYDDSATYLPLIVAGGTYSVTLYPDSSTVGANFVGSVFVESCELISQLRDQTMYEVKGKTTGSFTATAM